MATMVERNKDNMKPESVNVLETTEYAVKHAKTVSLHKDKVAAILPKAKARLEQGLEDPVMGFGA